MRCSRAVALWNASLFLRLMPSAPKLTPSLPSLAVDVWDGDAQSPVITHGRTLTSSIPVRDVLSAINTYAFLASPYPVILSFEIHCSVEQQDALARILVDTLGDRLVREQVDGRTGEVERLPSPTELKGKVLLKAKNLFLLVPQPMSRSEVVGALLSSEQEEIESSSSTNSDSDFKRGELQRWNWSSIVHPR